MLFDLGERIGWDEEMGLRGCWEERPHVLPLVAVVGMRGDVIAGATAGIFLSLDVAYPLSSRAFANPANPSPPSSAPNLQSTHQPSTAISVYDLSAFLYVDGCASSAPQRLFH